MKCKVKDCENHTDQGVFVGFLCMPCHTFLTIGEGTYSQLYRNTVAAERKKVAQWMMQRGYATGHGDTIEDLLAELDWQIAENWNRAMINGMKTEREACAKVAAWILKMPKNDVSAAIRARGSVDER